MALPNDYYVDGDSGNDTTGDGSSGTPWATIDKAFTTVTRDATDGDRVLIKARAGGAAYTLSSSLDLASYAATASAGAPLILEGYGSTIGDGTRAIISGNSSVQIINANAFDYCQLKYLELKDSPSTCVRLDNNNKIFQCLFRNSGDVALHVDSDNDVQYNVFVDCSKAVVVGGMFRRNVVVGTTGLATSGFYCQIALGGSAIENVVWVSTTSTMDIVRTTQNGGSIHSNSVYNDAAGTGPLIAISGTDSKVFDNIVEGASGTGGIGIELASGSKLWLYGYNKVYDCATAYDTTGDVYLDLGNNDTLLSSPFADATNKDMSLVSSLKATAYLSDTDLEELASGLKNYFDPGAIQREEAGGGLLTHPGMQGGARG